MLFLLAEAPLLWQKSFNLNLMRKFVFILSLMLSFSMARAQQTITGTHTYTYVPESMLLIEEQADGQLSVSVERGKNLVFTYEFRKKDDPAIADDEYTMRIMFEVPLGAKTFNYNAKDIKVVLMKGCYCTDRGYHRILIGNISGTKTCKGWKIKWKLETKTVPDATNNNWNSETKKAEKFTRPKVLKVKSK